MSGFIQSPSNLCHITKDDSVTVTFDIELRAVIAY